QPLQGPVHRSIVFDNQYSFHVFVERVPTAYPVGRSREFLTSDRRCGPDTKRASPPRLAAKAAHTLFADVFALSKCYGKGPRRVVSKLSRVCNLSVTNRIYGDKARHQTGGRGSNGTKMEGALAL